MDISVVERPALRAAVLQVDRVDNDEAGNNERVREAMRRVGSLLHGQPSTDGYVFIPQWQLSTVITTLWVGLLVEAVDPLPDDLQTIAIAPRQFARVHVNGDRDQMWAAYHALDDWFARGPYERDLSQGSFGYEVDALAHLNATPSLGESESFDFDVFVPIQRA